MVNLFYHEANFREVTKLISKVPLLKYEDEWMALHRLARHPIDVLA